MLYSIDLVSACLYWKIIHRYIMLLLIMSLIVYDYYNQAYKAISKEVRRKNIFPETFTSNVFGYKYYCFTSMNVLRVKNIF